jgi:hypothetical protein
MKTTITNVCKAQRPLFCRYHGDAKRASYEKRLQTALVNAQASVDRAAKSNDAEVFLDAKQYLDNAQIAYAATIEGEQKLREEIEVSYGLERDVLQKRLDDALAERDELEQEDDQDGIYSFPSSKLDEAVAKIEKANRKLTRAGLEGEFGYTTSTYIKTDPKTGEHYEMTRLELNRPPVKIGGWDFVASVDKAPNNDFITRVLPGQDLNGYRPDAQECEHCGSTRRRNTTYLLRSEDGSLRQVGSNCLEPFLGVKPKGLWALNYDPEENEPFYDKESPIPKSDKVLPLEDTIAMALAVSDDGARYVSKTKAYEYGGTSTAESVMNSFYSSSVDAHVDHEPYREKAKEIISSVNFEGDSDYNTNMRTVLGGEWVSNKHVGLAVSAVGAYQRQKFFNEKKTEPKSVGFLGEPKDKIKDVKVTVKRVDHYENDYSYTGGMQSRLIMVTEDGKEVKWQASSYQDLKQGDKLLLTGGSVKGHGTFNGNDQTIITRTKFAQLKEE